MKKIMILIVPLAIACGAFADDYLMKSVQPNASNVATITNTTADTLIPLVVYTDLVGSTKTNVATVTYTPNTITVGARTYTNSVDNGITYRVGTFSQIGGSETTAVMNTPEDTDNVGYNALKIDDQLTFTGNGHVLYTNVYYRVLFKVE